MKSQLTPLWRSQFFSLLAQSFKARATNKIILKNNRDTTCVLFRQKPIKLIIPSVHVKYEEMNNQRGT